MILKNSQFISKLPKDKQHLIEEILELKKKHGVTFLAHNYQRESVQLIADVLGDSLALARAAQKIESDYLLFCGVKFMAETASVLNPDKKIIFPEKKAAQCSLAAYVNKEVLKKYKEENPGVPLVLYINTTAESKTVADVICTSSNSFKIVKSIADEFDSNKVGFSPDKNLAAFISKRTDIILDIIPDHGNCYVHNDIYSVEDIERIRKKYPDGKLLVHPEVPIEIQNRADFIGSTSQIINFAKEHQEFDELLIGTELGVVDLLRREYPDKTIEPLNKKAICKAMKRITLKSILKSLKNLNSEKYIVKIDEKTAATSRDAINKMMELS
ncbi:MAG: quinolinate synthase NadA [Promethearchaeota archaeon]